MSGKKLYLVLHNLQAKTQPGVTYGVYLNLPAGTPAEGRGKYRVGSINFFDATGHAGHGAAKPRMKSFEVTDLLKKHAGEKALAASPVVSIIPNGTPAAGAGTVVSEFSLVEH